MKRILRFFGCNGRVLTLRALARLHCALPVAMGCAFVVELWRGQGTAAWVRGLLFCVPAAMSFYAARLRTFGQFLLASLLIAGLSGLLLGHPAGAVLALLVCLLRGHARLVGEGAPPLLERPYLAVMLLFLGTFLASAILGLPVAQRLSVVSAVLYALVMGAFFGVARLENYLTLNRDMSNLPSRRIRRIAGGALGAALLLGALLLLPEAARLPGDFRIVLPQKTPRTTAPAPELDLDGMPAPLGGAEMLEGMLGGGGGGFRIPDPVTDALIALFLAGVGVLAGIGVVRLLRRFQAADPDSRDEVQSLTESADAQEVFRRERGLRLLDRSPNAVIRRRYRRAVRRRAGGVPKRWQSPAEIEVWAGVEDPTLHRLYEKARYGPVPCSPEEARQLRRERKT